MLSVERRLEELLRRAEEMRRRGEPVSPEGLCRECPELIQQLRAKLESEPSTQNRHDTNATRQPPPPPLSSGSDDLQIGSEPIPGYKLVLRLGRGGYGEVWKANAPGGFALAMKFVPLATDGVQFEQRALDIIRTLRHPCLLTTVGSWQTSRHLVIAMELADRTLKDRFQEAVREGYIGIPRDEILEYFRDAAKGLDFLNEPRHPFDGQERVSFQHRDIKPENILLIGSGAKVADFGLVRLLEKAMTSHTGSMTPIYAAPEFFEGRTSQHSDQYSLAITYCHLRGGRVPFVGGLTDVMRGHLDERPDLTMLPVEERAIVERALSKVPTQRWPNCVTFIAELRNCLTNRSAAPALAVRSDATYVPVTGAVQSRPAKRRGVNFIVFGLVAACAVAVVAMNDSSKQFIEQLFAEKKQKENHSGSDSGSSLKGNTETSPPAIATTSTTVATLPAAPDGQHEKIATPDKSTIPEPAVAELADHPPVSAISVIEKPTASEHSEVAEKTVVEPLNTSQARIADKPKLPELLPDKPAELPPKEDAGKPVELSTPVAASTPTPTVSSVQTAAPVSPPIPSPAPASPPASTLKEAPLPEHELAAKAEAKSEPKQVAAAVSRHAAPRVAPPPLKAPFNDATAKRMQQAWATYLDRPVVQSNSIGMELTLIPSGEFTIGMDSTDVTRPPHAIAPQKVFVRSTFSIGTTEVTQAQWFQVMQTRPWQMHRAKSEDDLPATWISWTEANQFCTQLTKMDQENGQLGRDSQYQLPSEAEWEWACRAGTVGKFSCIDADLVQYCWYENNSNGESHPVRKLKPNPFGLFDMHGNVTEWCRDNFLNAGSSQPVTKGYLHGGNWKRTARHCASSARDPLAVDSQHSENGFRIMRVDSSN